MQNSKRVTKLVAACRLAGNDVLNSLVEILCKGDFMCVAQ